MKSAITRVVELALMAGAFFLVFPPFQSDFETYPLYPRLAYAGLLYAGSLALALRRKAENPLTALFKLGGLFFLGWALHLRCMA